jgi:PilZ domain
MARYLFRIGIVIGWGSNTLSAFTRDIGLSGMFVETTQPLWLRAEFTARISLPEPIEVDCIVKRVEPGRGMGVQFKDLPEAEREQLEMLVGKLARK